MWFKEHSPEDEEKRRLRDASVAFNAKDPVFCELFPDLVDGKPFTTSPHTTPPPLPAARAADAPGSTDAATTVTKPSPMEPVEAPVVPGTGRNAAKNRKKREKEKAKREKEKVVVAGGEAPDAEAGVLDKDDEVGDVDHGNGAAVDVS